MAENNGVGLLFDSRGRALRRSIGFLSELREAGETPGRATVDGGGQLFVIGYPTPESPEQGGDYDAA